MLHPFGFDIKRDAKKKMEEWSKNELFEVIFKVPG